MDCENILFKVDAPYPTVEFNEKNLFYAAILHNLYSSQDGELTAVLEYQYQSHFADELDFVKETVEGIAMVEMKHTELLADAIKKLGGNPRYVSSRQIPYSTRGLNYSTGVKAFLLHDITSERKAAATYQNAADMFEEGVIKDLLLRIKADEELHAIALECVLNKL